MPVRHRIDATAGLILLDLSGSVTRAEILGYYLALLDDPDLRPGLAVFADCRRVTSSPSFIELHAVANAQAQLPRALRPSRAAVLVNNGWLYGIVRQFAAMIERIGIRVMPFVNEAEAAMVRGRATREAFDPRPIQLPAWCILTPTGATRRPISPNNCCDTASQLWRLRQCLAR